MKLNPDGAEGLSCFFGLRERGTLSTDGVESLDGLLGGHLCSLFHHLKFIHLISLYRNISQFKSRDALQSKESSYHSDLSSYGAL